MFRSRTWCALVLAVCALVFAHPAQAQTTGGDLSGRVLDNSGGALPGVTVTVTSASTGVPQTAVSSETGAFRFAGLTPGTYRVQLELTGFRTLVLDEVRVMLGATTDVQPRLEISTIEEAVTVSGATPLVDTTAVKTGQTFAKEFLEGIPTARDPWVILEQTPGVVMNQQNVGGNKSGQQSAFVVRGSAQGNTMWNVDGVTITDMAATGSSSVYYDFDSFEQLQVTTGGQDASIQTGGLNLNMITKTGSNQFRGSGRVFLTDEEFQADNSTDALRAQGAGSGNPIQNIRDYGFEMGGPILRNRAWFWGGYGAQDIKVGVIGFRLPSAECQALPADAPSSQMRPCLNTDLTLLDNYNAKLNANLNNANKVTFSYGFSDKVRNSRDVAPLRTFEAAWKQTGPTGIYRGGYQLLAGDRFVVDSSASYVSGGFMLDFVRPELADVQAEFDLGTGLNSRSRFSDNNIRPQYSVQQDANYFLTNTLGADHALKFGWKWRSTPVERYVHRGGDGVVITRNGVPVEFTATRDQTSLQTLTTLSGYLNDSLTRGRVTVNAGVRVDYQNDSVKARQAPANPIVPEFLPSVDFPGADANVTWLDISPRAAVTYDLFGTGRTVLKASGSIFYGQGLFVSGALNALNEVQLTFPWTDLNGDGQAQRNELDLNTVRRDAGNWNPANPGAPTTPNLVDGDITNDRVRELIAGVEHAVMSNVGVSAMYIYRKLDGFQLTERQGLVNSDYVPTTATLNCGKAEACTQPSYTVEYFELRPGLTQPNATLLTNQDAWRVYQGLELTITKRQASRWMANASVTFNSAKNYWGNSETAFGDPTNVAFQEGRDALAQNARWVAKVNGLYNLPFGLNVSGTFNAREGFPFNPTVQSPLRAGGLGRATVNVEPFGTQRYDNFYQLDMGLEKSFQIRNARVSAQMDVFNVMNANTVLARVTNYSATTAGNVTEILAPRVIRFGARLRF